MRLGSEKEMVYYLVFILSKAIIHSIPKMILISENRQTIDGVVKNFSTPILQMEKLQKFSSLSKSTPLSDITVFDHKEYFKKGLETFFINYRRKKYEIYLKEKLGICDQKDVEKMDEIRGQIIKITNYFELLNELKFTGDVKKLCDNETLSFMGITEKHFFGKCENYKKGLKEWINYIDKLDDNNNSDENNNYINFPPDGL